MRHIRRAVVVVVAGLILGGLVAPLPLQLGPNPGGITTPDAPRVFEPTEGGHPVHNHDEYRARPPHEFPGRHVASATGVNVVPAVSGGRAESSGPGMATTGASIAVVLLAALFVAGLPAAARRMRPTAV